MQNGSLGSPFVREAVQAAPNGRAASLPGLQTDTHDDITHDLPDPRVHCQEATDAAAPGHWVKNAPMKIQLLYFDGCPHRVEMELRLRKALDLSVIVTTIERSLVDSQEAADRYRFAGSPSILIDGRDPFPSDSGDFGLTCRMYSTPEGAAGTPALEQLTEVIKNATGA